MSSAFNPSKRTHARTHAHKDDVEDALDAPFLVLPESTLWFFLGRAVDVLSLYEDS